MVKIQCTGVGPIHCPVFILYFPPQQGTKKGRAICYFYNYYYYFKNMFPFLVPTLRLNICTLYHVLHFFPLMFCVQYLNYYQIPDNTERNLKPCSKCSAIFKYRTVHTVHSSKDKRSCQLLINFSDTCC